VLAGIRQQEAELLEQWRSSGAMQIIDDVDVAAFEERSRRFFAKGFPFSALYMKISNHEY
jgi:hypothetical protein